jgi:hypothetical protein
MRGAIMNEFETLVSLAPVNDQEVEHFLEWLFGPGRGEDEMLEVQCTCGRRHWRAPGKEEEACPSCGGPCSVTGRFQQPDLNISDTRPRGNHSYSRGINPQEEHRVFLPTGLFG